MFSETALLDDDLHTHRSTADTAVTILQPFYLFFTNHKSCFFWEQHSLLTSAIRFCWWYMSLSRAEFSGGFCRCSCIRSCCCLSTFSSSACSRHWWTRVRRPSRSFSVDRPVPRRGAAVCRPPSPSPSTRRWRSDSWRWQARTCRPSSRSRSSSSVAVAADLDAMTSPRLRTPTPSETYRSSEAATICLNIA